MKKLLLPLFAIALLTISCDKTLDDPLLEPNPEIIDPRTLKTTSDSVGVMLRVPESTPANSQIRLVGSLQNPEWNVGDKTYLFLMQEPTLYRLAVPISAFGTKTEIEFKPVRGDSWDFEPLKADGSAINNLKLLKSDAGKINLVTIEKWKQ